LTGTTDEVLEVHGLLSTLIGPAIPEERIVPSRFPPPSLDDISDAGSAHLLWQAARMTLREGAAPLRSVGRIGIRPRVYQFVPLLMALRQDPVRLFIADDVGVGKTIEALLVARELLDRGEVSRLAVLCPPYLCDQWERELRSKFNLDAVVIRSSTIGRLERYKPADRSSYQHYPFLVISIDWVKSERNRYQFLQFCPELVIVDEAHGAAEADPRNRGQQQRHQLLREIAATPRRHLILLTATPHSGVGAAFRSLLGLLRREFAEWDVGTLTEAQRIDLARHFVQRTRADIERQWEGAGCFPRRESLDATYSLSPEYEALFRRTYDFCSEIVRTGLRMDRRRRRVRFWAALALLRCVMSSPAAAVAALQRRAARLELSLEESELASFVFERAEEQGSDEAPGAAIDGVEPMLSPSDARKLRALARLAGELVHGSGDTKVSRCVEILRELLGEGFAPIVWCRYVATAEYVAEALREALPGEVQVTLITGRIGDQERRMMIEAIDPLRPRVLVATDCLSEGINLQERFTAVLHYDLPWNPNRLEQREGRVDRYGQTAGRVKAIRFYGRDNPVDGVVIEVLLDKARAIHKALGTYVPVPQESESVMQAVLNSLFLRRRDRPQQLLLFEAEDIEVLMFHRRWDRDAERERINRTRFARRALKPEEVERELRAVDAVLGDPDAVREFVLSAAQRIGLPIAPDPRDPRVFLIDTSPDAVVGLPEAIRFELPGLGAGGALGGVRARFQGGGSGRGAVCFVSPSPDGAEYIGRNHRLVTALARHLLEESLERGREAAASRCGVMRTRAVDLLTILLLLRVRYLLQLPGRAPLLSEEVLVLGCHPPGAARELRIEDREALRLLAEARPSGNVPAAEKRELAAWALEEIGDGDGSGPLQAAVRERIGRRARELEASHKRIRRAVSLRVRELRVTPQHPPDLLGILILQPEVPR
jgi:superfamily II DNA or RNA helicase